MSALRVLVVAPLPEELRAVAGRRHLAGAARFAVVGDGAAGSARALEQLLGEEPARAVLVVGVAGALTRDLALGDVCLAERVWHAGHPLVPDGAWLERVRALPGLRSCTLVSVDHIVASAAAKSALARRVDRTPAAVDLESAGLARVAQHHHLPWLVIRAISDTADEELPAYVARAARADGSMDRGRIAREALLRPARWRTLLGLKRRVDRSAVALADAVEAVLPLSPG